MEPSVSEPSAKERIYSTLQAIPRGSVVSYGKLAEYAGLPGAARQVGRVLGQLPADSKLPWHRVITASGRIAFEVGTDSFRRQQQLLEQEQVPVVNGKVNMTRYGWQL